MELFDFAVCKNQAAKLLIIIRATAIYLSFFYKKKPPFLAAFNIYIFKQTMVAPW
jgi:hypothetical protein